MKIVWLQTAFILACASEEPVVDSTSDVGGIATDTTTDTAPTDTATTDTAPTTNEPTTDAPTTDDPTTDDPTTDDPTTDDPTTDDPTTDDPSTTGVDSDTSGTTTGSESSSGDDSTGPVPESCEGIDLLELNDPYVTPVEAKAWTAGGSVTVGVTMYNPGPYYGDYPSILVESDNPLVTSGMPSVSLFGIGEDSSVDLSVMFAADDAIEPGTEVTFVIYMASLDQVCGNGDETEVSATVE
jgi:hypothetical protein